MLGVLRYKRNVEAGVNDVTNRINAISKTLGGALNKNEPQK